MMNTAAKLIPISMVLATMSCASIDEKDSRFFGNREARWIDEALLQRVFENSATFTSWGIAKEMGEVAEYFAVRTDFRHEEYTIFVVHENFVGERTYWVVPALYDVAYAIADGYVDDIDSVVAEQNKIYDGSFLPQTPKGLFRPPLPVYRGKFIVEENEWILEMVECGIGNAEVKNRCSGI